MWRNDVAALGSLFVLACSSGGSGSEKGKSSEGGASSEEVCGRGDTRVCAGPGACKGAQTCLADRSGYGACDCGEGSGGSPSEGAGGTRAVGGASSGGAPASGGAATGGTNSTGTACDGTCCPTEPACYSNPALGNESPGAECLATADNTGTKHIKLRQQWIRATTPLGNTSPLVYGVLEGRSELPWKACNQGYSALGAGGYIQLIDVNLEDPVLENNYWWVGYAQYVPESELTRTLTQGFCFGEESYAGDPRYQLGVDEMSPAAGYPAGLAPPMALKVAPWKVIPAKSKRRKDDFNLSTDRAALLAEVAALAPTYNGVFYYDPVKGQAHGYSPLSWTVVYSSDGTDHVAIPAREVETRFQTNDPTAPNCVGAYRPEVGDPADSCKEGTDQANPAWGCLDDACPVGQSPATTRGYFLITELEQIFSKDLGVTLCVSYPGNQTSTDQGFFDDTTKSCHTARWNPSDPEGGLPLGDWCAATNSPATAACHDAYRSEEYHVYAGAKVQSDKTCVF